MDLEKGLLSNDDAEQKEDHDSFAVKNSAIRSARFSGAGTGLLIALSTLGALSFVERLPYHPQAYNLYKQVVLIVWVCLTSLAVGAILADTNSPTTNSPTSAVSIRHGAEKAFAISCFGSMVATLIALNAIMMGTVDDLKGSLTVLSFCVVALGFVFASAFANRRNT